MCGDLVLEGDALSHACRLAIQREALWAADPARWTERLRAVASKLRATAPDTAVALFLALDAVAPKINLSPMFRGTPSPMSPALPPSSVPGWSTWVPCAR